MAFGIVDLLQVGIVADRFDAPLQRDHLVVAGHHHDHPELQALGEVHRRHRHLAARRLDMLVEHARNQAPSLHSADRPLEFRLRADEHAKDGKDPICRNRPALVTREDILARLNTIRRARGPYAARHALGAVRRVFNFAADHGHAGIKVSPAANLRDKSVGLTGAMIRRQRILIEDEIKAVWHAASDAGMFGILVKCLSEDSIGPPRRLAGQATANTKSQPRQQRFSCRSRAQPQVAPP